MLTDRPCPLSALRLWGVAPPPPHRPALRWTENVIIRGVRHVVGHPFDHVELAVPPEL